MSSAQGRTLADEVSSAGVFCVLRPHMGLIIGLET
jgi:hypothetical protein